MDMRLASAFPLALVLAGCLSGGGGPGFAWHEEVLQVTDPGGIRLSGQLYGRGSSLHISANATNIGSFPFSVPKGCYPDPSGAEQQVCSDCENTPWSSDLILKVPGDKRPTDYPTHPYPHISCGDLNEHDQVLPGESREFRFEWNGTLWDNLHSGQAYIRAVPGAYTWSLYFLAVGPCRPACESVFQPVLNFTVVVP